MQAGDEVIVSPRASSFASPTLHTVVRVTPSGIVKVAGHGGKEWQFEADGWGRGPMAGWSVRPVTDADREAMERSRLVGVISRARDRVWSEVSMDVLRQVAEAAERSMAKR